MLTIQKGNPSDVIRTRRSLALKGYRCPVAKKIAAYHPEKAARENTFALRLEGAGRGFLADQ